MVQNCNLQLESYQIINLMANTKSTYADICETRGFFSIRIYSVSGEQHGIIK